MKTSMLLATLLATAGLAACERPTVVNTPPANPTVAVPVPVPVPGPAGPQGEAGKTGKPGETGVIIVTPAASEPAK